MGLQELIGQTNENQSRLRACACGKRNLNGESHNIHFQLLPDQTKIVGPVFLLPPAQMAMHTPTITMKLQFSDGTDVVVAAPTRELWAGADGFAYDRKPTAFWKVVSSRLSSGVIQL